MRKLKLLEKETKEVEPLILLDIPEDLLVILRYVYSKNNVGAQPSYKQITQHLGVTRPTTRKRIRELVATGYLKEHQNGRLKILEVTTKAIAIFMKESRYERHGD